MKAGTRVRHPKHGPGVVVGKATVAGAFLVRYGWMKEGWCKVSSQKVLKVVR